MAQRKSERESLAMTSALMSSIEHNSDRLFQVLIQAGLDETELIHAVKGCVVYNRINMLKTVLDLSREKGAAIITKLSEHVSLAANYGREKIIRLLAKSGVSLKGGEECEFNPLMVAAQRGHIEVIETLLSLGVKVDESVTEKSRFSGETALLIACKAETSSAVRVLIKAGADVNRTSKTGETPLMRAARHYGPCSVEAMQELIKGGADVALKDKNGDSAARIALKYSNDEGLRILLAAGSDPNEKNKAHSSLLEYCLIKEASYRGEKCALHLLNAGAVLPKKIKVSARERLVNIEEVVKDKEYMEVLNRMVAIKESTQLERILNVNLLKGFKKPL